MGNKIIIDEEVLAKLDELARLTPFLYKKAGILNAKQLILENSTTISIDESIEDRATIKNLKFDLSQYPNLFSAWSVGYKQGATEQSIISEIKSKDKEVRPFPCMNDEMCKEQCGACGYVQDKLTNK